MNATEYTLINDYTLQARDMLAESTDREYYASSKRQEFLTRIFNFEAQEVTVLGGVSSHIVPNRERAGSSCSEALQMQIIKFNELASVREVVRMHAKLIEFGGVPPSLDELNLVTLDKKATRLQHPGA